MILKRQISFLVIAVLLVAALAGCGKSNSDVPVTTPSNTNDVEASDHYIETTIENYDRTVKFTKKPERVTVLTLNSAEILAALGEAESIVGIARNANTVEDVIETYYDILKKCEFPDEINNGIPTLEGMLGLNPDLVVANSYYFNAPQIFGSLEDYNANGVEFYITEGSYVSNCTIENTYNDIRNIGAIFGKQAEAEVLVDGIKQRVSTVAETVKGQVPQKVMSFDSFDEDSFAVAGGSGLVQNLIELAGGINVFSDIDKQFSHVNIEEIIARNPDVIVIHAYTYMGEENTTLKINKLLETKELSEVSAVKNNNIIVAPLFQINPGLQNINYVESLAAAMFPELFHH